MNVDLIERIPGNMKKSSLRISGCPRSIIRELTPYNVIVNEQKPKKWDGFEFKIPKSVRDMSFKGDMVREFELDMQRIEYCYRKWKKKLKKKKFDIIDAEVILPGCCLTDLLVIIGDDDLNGILAISPLDSEIREFAEIAIKKINSNNT